MLPSSEIDEVVKRLEALGLANAFVGRRVLLTGARGFLGQWFAAVLSRLRARVMAVDSFAWGAELRRLPPEQLPNVEYVNADITQPPPALIAGGKIEFILALAGIASPVWYKKHPLETFDVSVKGIRCCLDIALAQGSRLLFSSSSEVYANPTVVPTPEDYAGAIPLASDRACYDVGKLAAETLCSIYSRQYGVDTRIVRYFNVYGPGLSLHDYRVLPNFVARVLAGERLKVYGTGNQTRTFCYVQDAVVGTLLALIRGEPGGVWNVGNDKPEISMFDLALLLERAAGRDGDAFTPERVAAPAEYLKEPQRRCPDLLRLRKLGYEPQVALQSGLVRYLQWASTWKEQDERRRD